LSGETRFPRSLLNLLPALQILLHDAENAGRFRSPQALLGK
jgi:hypothetical protein